jgi:hypothetical protein
VPTLGLRSVQSSRVGLGQRFLATFKESTHYACRVMLDEKTRLGSSETSLRAANDRLRSVFLHSWITTIAEGYKRIHSHLTLGSNQTLTQVRDLAYRLKGQLQAFSIPLTKAVAKWAAVVYTKPSLNGQRLSMGIWSNSQCRTSRREAAKIAI